MTCADIRAQLAELLDDLDQTQQDLADLKAEGGREADIERLQAKFNTLTSEIPAVRNQLEVQGCFVGQPRSILELEFQNPTPPDDFSATDIAGGEFPSSDAKLEWKQVLGPHDEDYEKSNLVSATGWVLNPDFSKADFPFNHPFGFDWEFMLALDRPADNPDKYTFLLARGNQSSEEGADLAIQQAAKFNIPIPFGPDDKKSLLGVEIDAGLVPKSFVDTDRRGVVKGDRIAVLGRWIVDCGHQVKVEDVTSFRAEIHPPLVMAAARVTTGSLLNPAVVNSPELTRVFITSRPYLVGQKLTTDTSKIDDDTAGDDGPFWDHMLKEVAKVEDLLSLQVEAHPKIKSRPFNGSYQLHLIVRPPPAGIIDVPGRVVVSFRFTVRTGCTVQVSARDLNTIDIFITLNSEMYTPPRLPKRHSRTWTRSDLNELDARANRDILTIEGIAALISAALRSGDPIGGLTTAAVVAILERGIETDEYDLPSVNEVINIFDTSGAITAEADQIPAGQGVRQNDNQPFPVFGWLEVSREFVSGGPRL